MEQATLQYPQLGNRVGPFLSVPALKSGFCPRRHREETRCGMQFPHPGRESDPHRDVAYLSLMRNGAAFQRMCIHSSSFKLTLANYRGDKKL